MHRSTQRLLGAGSVVGLIVVLGVLGVVLHAPTSVGAATLAHPVTVPIDVEHDGADTDVAVQVRIDGHGPYWFTLDTGASTSAVSARLAKTLHLHDTGATADFDTANGSSRGKLLTIDTWSAGSLPLQKGAVVTELTDLGQDDGLLGSDQLSRFGDVTINYQAETLHITPQN